MAASGSTTTGARIVHADVPLHPAPSGLPTRHLVSAATTGATSLFVAQQWLHPGQRVPRHTHPVEEVLTFLAGTGEATIGNEHHPIGPGTTLFIPAGIPHGFHQTGATPLLVHVVFPVPQFAETTFTNDDQ